MLQISKGKKDPNASIAGTCTTWEELKAQIDDNDRQLLEIIASEDLTREITMSGWPKGGSYKVPVYKIIQSAVNHVYTHRGHVDQLIRQKRDVTLMDNPLLRREFCQETGLDWLGRTKEEGGEIIDLFIKD